MRQLRHLRCFVTDDCFRTLVVSLVHSRLNYGNIVLVGLPVYLQRRLQSVLNAAARLVFRLRRYDHVTDSLATLHWLRLHCSNRQKHSKPLVYQSSQVYQDCTNSVPTVYQSSKTVKLGYNVGGRLQNFSQKGGQNFLCAYSQPPDSQTSQGRGAVLLPTYYTLVGVYSKKLTA